MKTVLVVFNDLGISLKVRSSEEENFHTAITLPIDTTAKVFLKWVKDYQNMGYQVLFR